MRISDWSSDVCSSDLADRAQPLGLADLGVAIGAHRLRVGIALQHDERHRGLAPLLARYTDHGGVHDAVVGDQYRLEVAREDVEAARDDHILGEIGRATCRERVCPYW